MGGDGRQELVKGFTDGTVVVTGAASGIGAALAESLVRRHSRLVLLDIQEERLQSSVEALRTEGGRVDGIVCDLSDRTRRRDVFAKAIARHGPIRGVCNVAGVGTTGHSWEMTPLDWDWVFEVNFRSVTDAAHVFIPHMLSHGQKSFFLVTASVAGLVHTPYQVAYNSSKHALVTLAAGLRQELDALSAAITVSALCPGFVNTAILDADLNRPEQFRGPRGPDTWANRLVFEAAVRKALAVAVAPAVVAEWVIASVEAGAFWIFTDDTWRSIFTRQTGETLAAVPPSFGAADIETLRG